MLRLLLRHSPTPFPYPPSAWQCDVTAVGATTCRHGVVANLMDISTGDRYIYPAVMLYHLMVTCAMVVVVVWYDINCRFGSWFMRWAASTASRMDTVGRLPGGQLIFPLPCFYKYSHR